MYQERAWKSKLCFLQQLLEPAWRPPAPWRVHRHLPLPPLPPSGPPESGGVQPLKAVPSPPRWQAGRGVVGGLLHGLGVHGTRWMLLLLKLQGLQ